MRFDNKTALVCCLVGMIVACAPHKSRADDLATMGVSRLRSTYPTLIGTGVYVAQPEALNSTSSPSFEVYFGTVGEPQSLFDWVSTNGAYTDWPNAAGTESSHADDVALAFYGSSYGVAPGVAHVDNYEADYYLQYVVYEGDSTPASDQVVNLSFAYFLEPPNEQLYDTVYDDYIYDHGSVFSAAVNGVGTNVGPPGTAYNCIGVSAYGSVAPVLGGPTLDNGRSKPDLVAPGSEVSFTVPYVSGAAAVLLQAVADGLGGDYTTDASNAMTIKALLLNGALKPFNWTHTTTAPLDVRYGAGVLNLYYSYQQLAGGKQADTSQNTVSSGGAHPPISSGTAIASMASWDYESVTILPSKDTVNHYLFNVAGNSTLTATLVWQRHANESDINNLSLFLYNATNGTLISSSVSTVDNVQHLYLPHLPAGKYDLEVVTYYANSIGLTENYALAFQFYPMSPPDLSVTPAGTNAIITWPSSPTVYELQQASSLTGPWSSVTATEWITNATVWTSVNNSSGTEYFRLVR